MKHRIACSVLTILGAIALTQTVASASDPEKVSTDTGSFGQVVGSSLVPDATVSVATVACPDGNACFWKQQDYGGDRKTADANDAGVDLFLGDYDRSMKNRFANRRVQIKDVEFNVIDCINPGGERSNLAAKADIFKIGVSGSSC